MTKPLRTLIFIVLAIAVVGAGAFALTAKKVHSPIITDEGLIFEKFFYQNREHDFSFRYPLGFMLTEQERGDAHRGHYQITLVRDEDVNIPEGGEGPIAVTVDVYQNNIDKQPVMNWITTTNIANIKLGDGMLEKRTVGGEEAYTNTWSGLYEGKTTTFAHGDDIIAVTVTWMTPEDTTLAAYEMVLDSFAF